ncbi:MAG: ABC transporter ATP-binding protein [Armatimonadetes bacterium]|nr:ABC transporter ATP-binding protein [Armatimonadota bacterium]
MTASGLGRRFGGRWIFRRIEFELEPGHALYVLGPNGSGKSTLLRILAGLLAASEGAVDPRPSESRAEVGYAALDLALYPHLSAAEHLGLAARLLGLPSSRPELLEEVGLGDVGGKLAGQFSSGMRARLKLALALQHSPKVLLLDEPSAALDSDGRALVEAAIKRQMQSGAVVVATNDPGDRRLATHELTLG